MSNLDNELLKRIADEVSATADAKEILDKLTELSKQGDTDAIELLAKLNQYGKEVKLRKELFGV